MPARVSVLMFPSRGSWRGSSYRALGPRSSAASPRSFAGHRSVRFVPVWCGRGAWVASLRRVRLDRPSIGRPRTSRALNPTPIAGPAQPARRLRRATRSEESKSAGAVRLRRSRIPPRATAPRRGRRRWARRIGLERAADEGFDRVVPPFRCLDAPPAGRCAAVRSGPEGCVPVSARRRSDRPARGRRRRRPARARRPRPGTPGRERTGDPAGRAPSPSATACPNGSAAPAAVAAA